MQASKEQVDITKKVIRQQIDASLNEVLANLHIQTKSKKVQKLIEKTSRKLATQVIKSLRKKQKSEKRAAKSESSSKQQQKKK